MATMFPDIPTNVPAQTADSIGRVPAFDSTTDRFLLRDGADGGISDEALLRQARQAAGQYLQASRTPRRRIRLQNLAWALAGAAATGLAWLLSVL